MCSMPDREMRSVVTKEVFVVALVSGTVIDKMKLLVPFETEWFT